VHLLSSSSKGGNGLHKELQPGKLEGRARRRYRVFRWSLITARQPYRRAGNFCDIVGAALFRRRVTLMHSTTQSNSLMHRTTQSNSLILLKVVCATERQWGQPTAQPRGLIDLSDSATKCRNDTIKEGDHERSKCRTLRLYSLNSIHQWLRSLQSLD